MMLWLYYSLQAALAFEVGYTFVYHVGWLYAFLFWDSPPNKSYTFPLGLLCGAAALALRWLKELREATLNTLEK